MKKTLLPVLVLASAAATNAGAATVSFAIDTTGISRWYGDVPPELFMKGTRVRAVFTIDDDPAFQIRTSNQWGNTLNQRIAVTDFSIETSGYTAGPVNIWGSALLRDSDIGGIDTLNLGGNFSYIDGDFKYTYDLSINLQTLHSGLRDPLEIPDLSLKNSWYGSNNGLSISGTRVDISGNCTSWCERNFSIGTGGNALKFLAAEPDVVPLPGAAWLFGSALVLPLAATRRRRSARS